ncbi:hypothetical protein G8C93_00930 [Cellulosimicrobium cellulans]|uniref:hypothetical protein n=1 Tax=Cellulosimicrobium cellulans TaxID=1710 RepID=UPI0018843DC7|nr:hypothetical protein [Cellulosimicrobium cellulans]MBE9924456.1 hypothetical protein [Cellulosimicrobium cellulans]
MRGGMSDYSLGLAQDRWDDPMCDRCGDLADHVSPDGLCDACVLATQCSWCGTATSDLDEWGLCASCVDEDLDAVAGAPTPAGVAVVLATVVALLVAGVLVAWQASPFDGAHLILAPALIITAAALAGRFVWVQHRREGVRS